RSVLTLLGELVEHRDQPVGILQREPGRTQEIFLLQVHYVVQGTVTSRLERTHDRRCKVAQLTQRHVSGVVLARKRSEQRGVPAALHPLATGVQVDLPARELRRQPHVLAVAAYGQGELVLVHYCLDGTRVVVAEHACNLCGRQRQLGEALRVRGPGDY